MCSGDLRARKAANISSVEVFDSVTLTVSGAVRAWLQTVEEDSFFSEGWFEY